MTKRFGFMPGNVFLLGCRFLLITAMVLMLLSNSYAAEEQAKI